jgi:predicted phosphodiesterase
MRYLILSDVHGNAAALEAVLEKAGSAFERIVCLGDIVGYGPDSNEVTERIRSLKPVAVVRGNHDKACCGVTNAEGFNPVARFAAQWTQQQLAPENLKYLQELAQGPVSVAGFQIVHGSPLDEDEYLFTVLEAGANLAAMESPLVFFGHTHLQGGFWADADGPVGELVLELEEGTAQVELPLEEGGKYLINPGSVGQPRDGDSRAGFALYDDEKRVVEYWRVSYDIKATQERMQEARLPEVLINRLDLGR